MNWVESERKEWCENSIRVKRFNLGKFHQWKSPWSGFCGLAHALPCPIFIFFQRLLVVGKCLQKYWVSNGGEPQLLSRGPMVDPYTSSLVDQLPPLFVVVVWCSNSQGVDGERQLYRHPSTINLSIFNTPLFFKEYVSSFLTISCFSFRCEKDSLTLKTLIIQTVTAPTQHPHMTRKTCHAYSVAHWFCFMILGMVRSRVCLLSPPSKKSSFLFKRPSVTLA